ncbi:MAG: molecular chaperone DjlA [Bacteroidetes bacterium]|nr:molecular chaperone DjlA [Bacteroidota bacterium]
MSAKTFFDVLRDSINQIVTGDEGKEESGSQKQRKTAIKNDIESAIIVLAAEVMRVSGNTSDETEKILFDFLEKNFGKVTMVKRKKLVSDHLFVGPQAYTKMACEQLKSMATHESKFEVIKLLYNIASADDFVNTKEHAVILKMSKYLGVAADELKSIKEQYVRVNNPFAILEMEENYTMDVVKLAYRKMVLKYHPDKRTDKVDTEEANRKFREIKKAYELILKQIKG